MSRSLFAEFLAPEPAYCTIMPVMQHACAAGKSKRCDNCMMLYCPYHVKPIPPPTAVHGSDGTCIITGGSFMLFGGHTCEGGVTYDGHVLQVGSADQLFERRQSARKQAAEMHARLDQRRKDATFPQTRLHPAYWSITMRQLLEFQARIGGGHGRNMYQIVKEEVEPMTAGTGVGLGLWLNKDAPKKADYMVSHAWHEDFDEFVSSLSQLDDVRKNPEVALWICSFGLFQNDDGSGPSKGEQVGQEACECPFRLVILEQTTKGMIIVHNEHCDIYSRLWCVYELFTAMSCGLQVKPALCDKPKIDPVDVQHAMCGNEDDKASILAEIEASFGFGAVNKAVGEVRSAMGL